MIAPSLLKYLKLYDEAIELNPNFPEAFHNRGLLLAKIAKNSGKNNFDDSLVSIDKALTLKPNSIRIQNNKKKIKEFIKYGDSRNSLEKSLSPDCFGFSYSPDIDYIDFTGLESESKEENQEVKNFYIKIIIGLIIFLFAYSSGSILLYIVACLGIILFVYITDKAK